MTEPRDAERDAHARVRDHREGTNPWAWRDHAIVGALFATALAMGWPIVSGGWMTYFDNPAHIAEIYSWAGEGRSGWSAIGFGGLSLDSLHSPLLWRGLALLDGWGIAIGPVYGLCACVGLAAPALAVFAVARRRVPRSFAAALAYVVLIQRPALVGTSSATGGMWTFYLATGALVLLADRLARRSTGARDAAAIAALLGLIGLTHLFVLEAAVLLVMLHLAWTLNVTLQERKRGTAGTPIAFVPTVRRDVTAGIIAMAASAWYWLPVLAGAGPGFQPPQNMTVGMLGELLFLPSDAIEILAREPAASALPGYAESVPQALLVVLGLGGAACLRRRDADALPMYGALLALAVATLLLVARPLALEFLGPVSWRFLYFVRVGCALSALAALARLGERVRTGRSLLRWGVLPAMVASGLIWGRPLAEDVARSDGREIHEVRLLWSWLRTHHSAHAPRVVVQDTFLAPPRDHALARSHVLALTSHEAGVEPVGAFYGVVPASTAAWTLSEFGRLLDMHVNSAPSAEPVAARMHELGARAVVTATRESGDALLVHPGFSLVHEVGRFRVFERRGTSASPLDGTIVDGAGDVRVWADQARITVDANVEYGSRVRLRHAYHPFWELADAPTGAALTRGHLGLLEIVGVGPGRLALTLSYRPPVTWPVSLAGWLAIASLTIERRRGRGRHR